MPEIDLTALIIAVLPSLGVIWLGHRWAGAGRELLIATTRMVVQLLAIGFVLVFIFGSPNPLVGLGVVAVMIAVSSAISIRVLKEDRRSALGRAALSLGLGGGAVLLLVLFGVLRLHDPWYQPRVIIPIAGMVLSNAMTAVTLAAERLQNDLAEGHGFDAARRASWTAAMIPQINALLAVGLVALPGMMTGQILSGVDPLVAVRYQIVVMAMVLQSSGFSVALFLVLSARRERNKDRAGA